MRSTSGSPHGQRWDTSTTPRGRRPSWRSTAWRSPWATGAGSEAGGDAPLVAFYGDSYTRGTGATDPSLRWSTLIAEERGWREFNPSVNGLGFVNNRDALGADLPGQIIEADPDIVFVTMGLNDAFSFDRVGDGIRDRIEDDFARLTAALPDARFIVVEPFWYTEKVVVLVATGLATVCAGLALRAGGGGPER